VTRLRISDDRGAALLMALAALLAVSAVATAVTTIALMDLKLAATARDRAETAAFASAAAEVATMALSHDPDWSAVLSGAITRELPGAGGVVAIRGRERLDLDAETRLLQAGQDARSTWGANTPHWRLYMHGELGELFSPSPVLAPYVAVWVADDEAEQDGAPDADSNGRLEVRADAFGRQGSRHAVLVTLRRRVHGVELVSWRRPRE
jgi:hypothetical protein